MVKIYCLWAAYLYTVAEKKHDRSGKKNIFLFTKTSGMWPKTFVSVYSGCLLVAPIFSYFLGSFIGIGSSLLLIVFSNHTDNPEIHKCRFCLCKGQTFAQSGLKHLQFTPEDLYKLSCFKKSMGTHISLPGECFCDG